MIDDWRKVGVEPIGEVIKELKRDLKEVQNAVNSSIEKGDESATQSAIFTTEHIEEVEIISTETLTSEH